MALFISTVLGNKVEVFAADDEGSVHFGRDNGSGEDTPTDGDLTGEGTLLVCISRSASPSKAAGTWKIFVPMYVPSMAVFGVLKPSPTSLNHLRPPFPAFVLLALFAFVFTKMCGCFWKARSDCTVNSVAIVADCRDNCS